MNLDTLMLVAFGIFIVLLVWRMREQSKENVGNQKCKTNEKKSCRRQIRQCWKVVQVIILCGLLFYMVPLLWKDFQLFEERDGIRVGLRCLVFIFTIFILFVRIGKWIKERRTNIK